MRSFGYFLILLTLVGCNTQIAVTGAERKKIMNRPPIGARWVKDGMTRDSRKTDWVACGGGANMGDGFRDWISSRESRKNYFDGLDSHKSHLRICMQSKGYEYREPQRPGKPDECDDYRCLYP